MNTLHVMDRTGDRELTWDPDNQAQVAAARRMFDAMREQGFAVYALAGDGVGVVLHDFDPATERMVATPRIVGG